MYNNKSALTLNDSITTLVSMNDNNNEIALLREFLEEEDLQLTEDQKEKLKTLKRLLTLKNTVNKGKINQVANSLNKLGYY